ncbi:hypothetical protein GCM10027341_51310 [Spirosoma knui]
MVRNTTTFTAFLLPLTKYSFEFYRNIVLNAMVIAIAVAAISNHVISLIELGVLLLGLFIQLGLAAYKPNAARQFE